MGDGESMYRIQNMSQFLKVNCSYEASEGRSFNRNYLMSSYFVCTNKSIIHKTINKLLINQTVFHNRMNKYEFHLNVNALD